MLIPLCLYLFCACFAALIVLSACAAAGSNLSAWRRNPSRLGTTLYPESGLKRPAALNPISAPRSPRGAVGRSALSRSAGSGSPLSPDPAIAFVRLLALSQSWRRVA